jgi:multidrug resistance efflux pump
VNPNFVDGGFFEAGEVLVRLEDADYRLAVTRAEALVAQRRQLLIREQAEAELAREEWEVAGRGRSQRADLASSRKWPKPAPSWPPPRRAWTKPA